MLLVGIVGLNVMALSFSASSSTSGRAADELRLLNSSLRGDIATKLSNQDIQAAAAKLGMVIPEPGAIRYLELSRDDAATAAQRLRDGELGLGGYVAPPPTTTPPAVAPETTVTEQTPATDPELVAAEPAPEATAPVEPVETVEPAPTEPAPTVSDGGGLTAP